MSTIEQRIEALQEKIQESVAKTLDEIEQLRVNWLGRKGEVTLLIKEFANLKPEEKKKLGLKINKLKEVAQSRVDELKCNIGPFTEGGAKPTIDTTRPSFPLHAGGLHPLRTIENEIIDIFRNIGFAVEAGPEIEDDWHVFSALNFPKEHPARDMQDTFFIKDNNDLLLRTHTSSVQIRMMEKNEPPLRFICPGRVYRNEDISARSHCQFHQIEGLCIDYKMDFGELKRVLDYFAKQLFGPNTKIRLRSSYFPFTEPSAEMDVSCNLCKGKGCSVCKNTGWLEILGAGMVHPNVLKTCSIDPNEWSGYAFGLGIERICMLKMGITDIRLFFENDIRFTNQYYGYH